MNTGKKLTILITMVFMGLIVATFFLLLFKQLNQNFKLDYASAFIGFIVHVTTSAVGIRAMKDD